MKSLQSQRGDYNGKLLTLRTEDLRSLAIMQHLSPMNSPTAHRLGRTRPPTHPSTNG